MTKKTQIDNCQHADSPFWKEYFGLVDSVPMSALRDGKCDRPDCRGYRIPGYLKPTKDCTEAVVLRCPQCHGESLHKLKPVPKAAVPAPEILTRQNESPHPAAIASDRPTSSCDRPEICRVELINVKAFKPSILDASDVVYIGRQIEWKGQYLKDSPLRNLYKVGRDGDRDAVCDRYRDAQLKPAMQHRKGPVWKEINRLAARVAAGENLRLACWCLPERCHGLDVADAVTQVAKELVS